MSCRALNAHPDVIRAALNADAMTDDQLHAALQVGIKEIQNGDIVDAASAFAQFREQHR